MLRLSAVAVACLCIAPLVLVLSSWWMPLPEHGRAIWSHVQHMLLGGYIGDTALLCLGVTCIAGISGITAAWLTARYRFWGAKWLAWALILPLAMPAYVSAYSYGWLLEYGGPVQSALRATFHLSRGDYYFPPIRSLGGAMWILGMATAPYVYLLARAAFLSQPREWWEAAASMGAGPGRFLLHIALPAARPFIAMGVALALMETLADIGTVGVLGVQTVSAGIYRSWFYLGEPQVAARLAGLLMVFVCAVMAVEAYGRRGLRYGSLRAQLAGEIPRLHGWKGTGAFLLCLLPVAAGFLLPLGILLRLASYSQGVGAGSSLLDYTGQTVWLAVLAGIIACGAALLMVCAERFHRNGIRPVILAANLGYAIPGAVVAVGLLLLFGWLRDYVHPALFLTGTAAGLLAAYTVRFMATAYGPLHSGMQRIPEEMDMAAASLGKGRGGMVCRIHLPLLAYPLCVAFIMVFLDVVKELPATLILRPFDVKTLALAAYEYASDDRQVEASPYALVLVAVSTLAVLALHRLQHAKREWNHVGH